MDAVAGAVGVASNRHRILSWVLHPFVQQWASVAAVALPPDPQSWSPVMSAPCPHDSDVPHPDCPTCGTQMWIVMAPPLPTADVKEDWLFRCPVCKVIVPLAQT
jgi:hypothetical protein